MKPAMRFDLDSEEQHDGESRLTTLKPGSGRKPEATVSPSR